MAKHERRNIYRRLAGVSETLPIAEVRASLATLELDRPHFLLQQAIDGPFALTGLIVNGRQVIDRAIRSSQRSIAVPIGASRPFEIRWSAVCFQNQPKCVGYWVDDPNAPIVLEEKRGMNAADTWVSKPHGVQ